ncbi:MAG: NADH-quinone oxidoreductase subunit D [Dehalococcoidales bacterium]|nr:NADH-quinone oxidoreductase subunit D [Dehalococcoidales bacterium]
MTAPERPRPGDEPPMDKQSADVVEELVLNMGPQHPATHGVLRLVLRLQGERVLECTPYVGYLHRGIEKILENRTFNQGVRYVDQFDYITNMLNEHAYVGAIEQIMGVEVPRRAEYIRVIMGELSRCGGHLVGIGSYLLDLGAWTPITYCFRDREEILDLYEMVCGSRMNFNYYRAGGLLYDLPTGFLSRLEGFLKKFERNLDELEDLVSGNEIFLARTVGIGYISPEMGLAYSVSGPCIRASGVEFDVRTFRPYGVYPELGVKPVVRLEGDCFARYEVRLYEMRESIRLIRLAMERLPGGPIQARLPHVVRPPKGEACYSVEGAKGEMAVYMVSDGQSPNPYRAKVRGPSFVNLQILPELVKDATMADVVSILGSIDIVLGEVDR